MTPTTEAKQQREWLSRFGFDFEHGSPHTSRTMMLNELERLLAAVDRPDAYNACRPAGQDPPAAAPETKTENIPASAEQT